MVLRLTHNLYLHFCHQSYYEEAILFHNECYDQNSYSLKYIFNKTVIKDIKHPLHGLPEKQCQSINTFEQSNGYAITLRVKKILMPFLKTWIPSTKRYSAPCLIEIDSVALEKKNLVIFFSLYVVISLSLNKLEFPSPN